MYTNPSAIDAVAKSNINTPIFYIEKWFSTINPISKENHGFTLNDTKSLDGTEITDTISFKERNEEKNQSKSFLDVFVFL